MKRFFGLLLLVSSCVGSGDGGSVSLLIGTGQRPGLYYAMGELLSGAVNSKSVETGLTMEVEESSGSVFNINALMARSFEFGFAQMDLQAQAYLGEGYWEGVPQERLRFVCSLWPELVSILVLEGSGLERVTDLSGKRVAIGAPGSGTRGDALAILRAAGVENDVQFNSAAPREAIRLLQSGDVDAIFYTGGLSSPLLNAASAANPPIRMISVSNREALLRQERELEAIDLPGGLEGVQVRTVLLSSIDVSEDEVYEVVRILFENLESFQEAHPQFVDLDPEEMVQGSIAPIHPGALEYYEERGWVN